MNGILDQQTLEGVPAANRFIGTGKRKKCFKCLTEKPLLDFHRHHKMKDGHINKCKECVNGYVRGYYKENIDTIKEYEKSRSKLPHRVNARFLYSQTPDGKEAGNRAKVKWNKQNPEKRIANVTLGNAVRAGRVTKMSCEVCGSTYRIHGHHDDYDKPLDVKWFCSKHHREYHAIFLINIPS